MSDPQIFGEDIQRLWQEAEVYENQGLYDHAVLVYQHILNQEPDNRKAQAKIVQIQFTQRMAETTSTRRISSDEPSSQLSMDLGLAYMGMNLYDEALDAFKEALKALPARMPEVLRYIATCLLGFYKAHDTEKIFDEIVTKTTLTAQAKGEVISQMIVTCLDEDGPREAFRLLELFPDETKKLITDYEELVAKIGASVVDHDESELLSESSTAHHISSQSDSGTTDVTTGGRDLKKQLETSIPLNARIRYSFDNKHWLNGMASRLSADWAMIHLPSEPMLGDSLVLQLHLPTKINDEPVWVLARISQASSESQPEWKDYPILTKADFVSFLPAGETILKSFIDEVVKDASILSESSEVNVEGFTERAVGIYDTLHEEAIQDRESGLILDISDDTVVWPLDKAAAPKSPVAEEYSEALVDLRKIRFACQCGQVHVVGALNVGRKGKCKNCGKALNVPQVDSKPDQISEQITGKIVGGCRLLYKIGGGGMGGVFKAHHIGLDIPVAVKILYSHLAAEDPIFIKRFIREARAAAKLQHPNIVGVMNVGHEHGLYYLIMPFIEGGSAALMLAKAGRLPTDTVLQIGIEITRALGLAEDHNLLHRDIKPANILFSARGEAMLADLGLAKTYLESQDQGMTQSGIACGTPLYFSPEQAKGIRKLDIRSDIYSLGITLYHMLNGSPPFTGDSPFVVFQKHVNEPLPPLQKASPPIPDSVFKLLQKMTAKNPDDRFPNSQELLSSLENLKKELTPKRKRTPSTKKKTLLEKLGLKKSR